MRYLILIFTCLVSALWFDTGNAAGHPIDVDTVATWPIRIQKYAEIFDDVSGKLSFSDVSMYGKFRPAQASDFKSRFTTAKVWIRFTIRNLADSDLRLYVLAGSPRIKEVEFFRYGGDLRIIRAGAAVPLAEQPTPSRYPLFPVLLQAGESATVYIAARSGTPLHFDPYLFGEDVFLRQEVSITFWNTVLIGGLAAFAFCSFLLFVFSPMRSFGWLALLGVALCGFEAAWRGYGKTIFWPNFAEWNYRSPTVLGGLVVVLFITFAHSVAKKEGFELPAKYLLTLLACFMGGVMVVGAVGNIAVAAQLAIYGGALFNAAKVGLAATLIKRVMRPPPVIGILAVSAMAAILLRLFEERGTSYSWAPDPQQGFDPNPWWALAGLAVNVAFIAAWFAHIGRQRQNARRALETLQRDEEERLKNEVMRQTAALNESLEYARRQNEDRSRVLGYVSHDLRAPLATVLGYVGILKIEGGKEIQPYVDAMERSLQYQQALIRDIVEYSKGELAPFQLQPRPLDLQDLLISVCDYGARACAEHGNRFEPQIHCMLNVAVEADGVRLQQVFLNLLSNAAKFTTDGVVRFRAVAQLKDGDCELTVLVEDDGPGIPVSDQSLIFAPYVRTNRETDGVGLGLYIAEKIVMDMGGTLRLKNVDAGYGSVFELLLRFPLAGETVDRVAPIDRPEYHAAKRAADDFVDALPPPYMRLELAAFAREGRITEIEHWIAELRATYPGYGRFATEVERAVEVLDLDRVEALALAACASESAAV